MKYAPQWILHTSTDHVLILLLCQGSQTQVAVAGALAGLVSRYETS